MEALSAAVVAAGIQFLPQQPPLLSGAFLFQPATGGGGGGGGGVLSFATRTQSYFPQRRRRRRRRQLLVFQVKSGVKSVKSFSSVDELQHFRVVPSNVLTAEKEEVKAVLTMFLKKEIGLGNEEAAAATISKSVPFIDHLVARLHSIHKSRYLVGRELTTLEIRDTLIPYLEYLCKEHEHSLDDIMQSFPNLPEKESIDHRDNLDDVVDNLDEVGTDEQLPPNTHYLLEIGLDMDQIKEMARKYPSITCPGWERNLKPLVVFLLDLGMPPTDIPKILYKQPQFCCLRLSENIIPSMAYLETLGLDKTQWAKVIRHHPPLLALSKQNVKATVDYLYELGLSTNKIGKVLTRCPRIIGYSVDDNLRPKAEYFQSLGVNPGSLLSRYPNVFNLSIECKLKPVTEFFLDKGYSIDEIGTMATRHGMIYTLSLTNNLIPKWDFFLTMDYPRSELVKFPTYFGLSLERRIKPRYALMRECGVKLSMSRLLAPSDSDFYQILNKDTNLFSAAATLILPSEVWYLEPSGRQAVHRAPHYPESHNLNGLVCEVKFDYQSAIADTPTTLLREQHQHPIHHVISSLI